MQTDIQFTIIGLIIILFACIGISFVLCNILYIPFVWYYPGIVAALGLFINILLNIGELK